MKRKNKKGAAHRRQNAVQKSSMLTKTAVALCSSRVGPVFDALQNMSIPPAQNPRMVVNLSTMSFYKTSAEEIDRLVKRNIRANADMLNEYARMSANARKEYSEKFDRILEKFLPAPFPAVDYQQACKLLPMSREEYLDTERQLCQEAFWEKTSFTLCLQVNFSDLSVPCPVYEAEVLQILAEPNTGASC